MRPACRTYHLTAVAHRAQIYHQKDAQGKEHVGLAAVTAAVSFTKGVDMLAAGARVAGGLALENEIGTVMKLSPEEKMAVKPTDLMMTMFNAARGGVMHSLQGPSEPAAIAE